ncbi:MAG: hypothetical protein KAS32_07345 [Candidatus Peribacteraceae bacterium]|nr:hypothetical protein [Candidatus Peribacteraceae bacterium]
MSIDEPVYRDHSFTAQVTGDDTADLINLLAQAVFSYRDGLSDSDLGAVALWFKERFTSINE